MHIAMQYALLMGNSTQSTTYIDVTCPAPLQAAPTKELQAGRGEHVCTFVKAA
jgi:hypothetical protein